MKKNNYIFFIYVILILFSASCSKGGGAADDHNNGGGGGNPSPNDVTAPVLEIFTPTANQAFTSGNSINITGRITDDLGLYRGSIRITNDANGSLWREQLYDIHYVLLYNYNISEAITVPGDYTITVRFEDHGYNSATKSVKIKVNP